jgi:hypothetical protein
MDGASSVAVYAALWWTRAPALTASAAIRSESVDTQTASMPVKFQIGSTNIRFHSTDVHYAEDTVR